ncbi:uncharacterized protein DUF3826 [Lacibacter cauensis]|uniref:Uncharacterized protein DUF3826 n=1 Tax=Lacibacter cauensis TaxID=510947 RepID=A0A562SWL0_9BACT|nr:DUF3826 domain-containing protein [Lacibacter cauensis]TWI85140.1 uncharacterized protein DUF3826 [Lacibacter cauensis]
MILSLPFLHTSQDAPKVFIRSLTADLSSVKKIVFTVSLCAFGFVTAAGQNNQTAEEKAAYIKTVTDRSAKIVNTLSIKDSATYKQVLALLVYQYSNINRIHEETKIALAAIKQQSITAQESALQVQKQEEKKNAQLQQLHTSFLAGLQTNLTGEQIELVKDGMTYKVLHVTYTAYVDMIPSLTEEQKKKIYDWLVEARELAMDSESSDKKHAIFGKYKGRINNYLAAAGYDLTKEREEWQKRIKEKNESSK